jgi:hypothetical protein
MDEEFDFGDALYWLREGQRVCRKGWNGKNMYLVFVDADKWTLSADVLLDWGENAPMQLPWIGMKTADNKFVPWLASQTDLAATDWKLL